MSYICSPLIAEGLALRDAVAACLALGLKEVKFESDSDQLIKAINRKEPTLELYGIVSDILWMANEFDIAVFSWIPRLKNCVADVVAKRALLMYEQELVEINLIPPPN